MKRDKYQRRAYAARRMSLAVDRLIRASNQAKANAKKWVNAWASSAGIRRPAD